MATRAFAWLGIGLLALGVARSVRAEEPIAPIDLPTLNAAFGLDEEQSRRMLEGEIVAVRLEESTEKQLAIGLVIFFPIPLEQVYAQMEMGDVFDVDQSVLDHGRIGEPLRPRAALESLTLPKGEINRLREAAPGSDFNFSSEEFAALRLIARSGGSDADVMTFYRDALAARVVAYRRGGVEAIAPYDRGDGERSSAGQDIQAATAMSAGLKDYLPRFHRSLARYPEAPDPGIDHAYFWVIQMIQDRPTVILVHRMTDEHDGHVILFERRFYVGQSYDALQVGVIGVEVPEGTVIFYANRTFTEQVTGWGAAAARGIGRAFLEKEVRARAEHSRRHDEGR